MPNWAIVIGIDQYWTSEACLKGAVRDSLQMREWLLDTNGGGVSKSNLYLLLGPSPNSLVPAGVQYLDAKHDTIIQVINQLTLRSAGQGDRLFFYYAGHGLTARIQFSDEEALIPSDFTDLLTDKSLMLRSICEYFEATQFGEQFFFIDACRNIPWDQEFTIGSFPRPRRRDPSLPAVQQFIFYATSPGVKAAEIGEAGKEYGAFTAALMEGLSGKGTAKAWDLEYEEYVVTAERLIKFIRSEMSNKQLALTNMTSQLVQIPRLAGERGGSEGVLARFPAEAFPQEILNVYLEPSAVASTAEISVERESVPIAKQTQLVGLPVIFVLPPKEYNVRGKALDHEPLQKRWFVELYSPQQVTIQLMPKPPSTSLQEKVSHVTDAHREGETDILGTRQQFSIKPNAVALREAMRLAYNLEELKLLCRNLNMNIENLGEGSLELKIQHLIEYCRRGGQYEELVKEILADRPHLVNILQSTYDNFGAESFRSAPEERAFTTQRPKKVRLVVETGDSLAPLEVADNLGKVVAAGQGTLIFKEPKPGFYYVRLLTPENQVLVEKLLEISADEEPERVRLDPPAPAESRLTQEVIKSAKLRMSRDNTLQVLESSKFGSVANPQLSTILTLVGGATAAGNTQRWSHADKLRSLGLKTFTSTTPTNATTGLQVLFGIESRTGEEALALITAMKLRLWHQSEPIPEAFEHPMNFSPDEGLAEFTCATQEGPHWLSLEMPQQKPLVLALMMMSRRLTMIVFHLDISGKARIFQYLPQLGPFQSREESPESLRRLEVLQRFYLSGRLDHVYNGIKNLLDAKWIEPVAGCLGGYLALRQGNMKDSATAQLMEKAVSNLRNFFGDLSDSHTLYAQYRASLGERAEVLAAFQRALDCGFPIFADGLDWLLEGVEQYKIEHSRVALLEKVVRNRTRGLLWSAWTPGDFSPGHMLV